MRKFRSRIMTGCFTEEEGLPSLKELRRSPVSLLFGILIAAIIYMTGIASPPSLMDDTDAVEAQIGRTMLTTGDWVSAHLDGVVYLEKSPLSWWLMDISYKVFGFKDWAARIPTALTSIGLAWLTGLFAQWAYGRKAGFCASLVMATCIGLWLFTRILIPDVMLTLVVAMAMWAFLRAFDEQENHPRMWAQIFFACLGLGLMLKSLIGMVFPIGAAIVYLAMTRQLFSWNTWRKFHPFSGILILLAIALPWHVLATLQNPPYFVWTLKSQPGQYHGFLWFYFINEQLLRFLNLRYPRDYDTVPRLYFWLFHLIWLFPWSVYLPAIAKLSFDTKSRAGRARLFALCWIGVILVFFTFSTTQEYYSMPCYPAFALLLGSAMAEEGAWVRRGGQALGLLAGLAGLACFALIFAVRNVPTPGDITAALIPHPNAYKLSLGHMEDLTIDSFAYLRLPLAVAGFGFVVGSVLVFRMIRARSNEGTYLSAALMMIIFFMGAQIAMIRFDPLLSSRDFATTILDSPPGTIILDHNYYWFSSIPFYTGRPELLLNGRWNNLEYGSNAPNAPDVFIDDRKLQQLWSGTSRYYLMARADQLARFNALLGRQSIRLIRSSGGKILLTNTSSLPAH